MYEVSGLYIWAGYHKSSSAYLKNSRPSAITLRFSNGECVEAKLEDKMERQTIQLDAPIQTKSVTIVIDDVYRGTNFEDTLISELEVF